MTLIFEPYFGQNFKIVVIQAISKPNSFKFQSFFQIVKKLGNAKLEDKVTDKTTHLVTTENRRTMNLLRGIIQGCYIVKYQWLLESEKAGEWVRENSHFLREVNDAAQVRLSHCIPHNYFNIQLNYGFQSIEKMFHKEMIIRSVPNNLKTLCSSKIL
jgi:hypothetical protein